MALIVHHVRHQEWLTNTYLIENTDTRTTLAIDAGEPPERFDSILKKNPLQGIFLTHHHEDHIFSIKEWAPLAPLYGTVESLHGFRGTPLEKKSDIALEGFTVSAIPTPGHVAKHLAFFVAPNLLFTGDLLFKGSVGGTSFGSCRALKSSIENLIDTLSPETKVYPGHGDDTTLGQESEKNPFLLAWRRAAPILHRPCVVQRQSGEILAEGRDYDGDMKYWVIAEGVEHIVCDVAVV